MSVTTYNYTTGGNVKKVAVLNELGNGSTNIISAVDSVITGFGWTAYDTVNTTLFNPIITKVYRALNADGVTYKYFVLRWDTIKLMLTTSVCEVWNTLAKIPQNESYQNFGAHSHGYDLVNCHFLIGGSARHLVLWNFIVGSPGPWSACIEFERVAPEDTAAAPGGSLQFNGTSDYLTVPNTASGLFLNGTGLAFTVEAWIFPTFVPGAKTSIILGQDNGTFSAGNANYNFGINTSSFLFFSTISNAGAQVITAGNSTILPNQWTHVAAASDGTTLRLFVNGVLQTATSTTYVIGSNSIATGIGNYNTTTGSSYFPGLITKLRVVKGTCLYPGSFSVPYQSQVPTYNTQYSGGTVANTQFFLGVTSAGNYIVDTSTNGYTVSVGGGAPAYNATSYFSGGNPCFAWTSSLTMGNQRYTNINMPYWFPRLPNSFTYGTSAKTSYVSVTNRGSMPPQNANYAYSADGYQNYGMIGSYFGYTYGWNTAAIPSSSISLDYGGAVLMPFGRIYNFGVIGRTIGLPGDTILANIDTTYGWPSPTANTQSECLALPLNGGADLNSTWNATNQNQLYFGNVNTGTSGPGGQYMVPYKSISIGDTIFTAMGNSASQGGTGSICSYQISGGNYQLPVVRAFIPGGVYDIVFDGNGYIWGSTANGVVRMDANTMTTTYFTSNQTIANGCGYLGIDNKNVYASSRIANTKPQVYTIDRATGNVWFGNSFVSNNTFTVASSWGTPTPDYLGNVIVGQTPGTTAAQSQQMALFQSNTGSAYAVAAQSIGAGAGVQNYGVNVFYDPIGWNGIPRGWVLSAAPASSLMYWYDFGVGNVSIMNTYTTGISSTTTTLCYSSFYGTTAQDNRGDMYMIPYRGLHIVGFKKPGVDVRATATSNTVMLVDWNYSPGGQGGNPFQHTTSQTTSIVSVPYGPSNWSTTNGVHVFHSFSSPQSANNVIYIQTGLYNPQNATGYSTSRLLLKG